MGGRAEHGQQVGGIVGVVAEHGHRQIDALRGQQLVRAQLVAGAQDGIRRIGAVGAHQFELPQHRRAVAGDGRADTGNDGVVAGQRAALVMQLEAGRGDAHVAAQRVQHPDRVAALACGLHQPAGRVQLAVARQDGELHGRGITWAAYSIARPEGRTMTTEARRGMERVMGIEPTLAAWEAAVLPLNYTRADDRSLCRAGGQGNAAPATGAASFSHFRSFRPAS